MRKDLGRILVIDDDEDVLHAARLLLQQHATSVRTETQPERIRSLLSGERYDVVLLDMNFARDATSGQEGFRWLNEILQLDPLAVVVLITAYGDVEMAVRAVKEGATDFVLKPWHNEKLLATLSAATNLRRSRLEMDNLRTRQKQLNADMDRHFRDFVGRSPAMQRVFRTIEKVAPTDANVLILGENGTGKELVARALHRQSPRRGELFISVDIGALSETLLESELFGHVKGAFTDAKEDRVGRFEIASGGTLFLDEIGNLSAPVQAKLLTVLETREVTRLGSNKSSPVDIRLICATNVPIHERIADETFRQDLLYRINTVEIHVPPLRERPEDIPLLVNHFIGDYSKRYQRPAKRVDAPALKKLADYHWPGNIRELKHAIERAVIMSDSQVLGPSDFFFPLTAAKEDGHAFDGCNLEEVEKAVIQRALERNSGNISQAARELGLTRASLYRRLEKYGL